MTYIVYRSVGGYWEPQEWIEHRKFDDREEAEAYVREAGRRGSSMRVYERSDTATECRRCGEVDECGEMGMCESCINHIRRTCPEARL